MSLLLICAAVVSVPLPVYAQRPGISLDLADCIRVEDPAAGPVQGDLLLTFVTYRRATLMDLVASLARQDIVLRPVERVIPRDVVPRDYFALQRQRFDREGLTAAAVGLERAGYPEPVRVTGDGARVVRTLEGFPADGVLQPGDVVVSAGADPVRTSEDLRDVILRGERVDLRVHRDGDIDAVSLAPVRSDVREEDLEGEPRYVIGAQLETVNPQVMLPVDIEIQAGRIGGPSAGLMVALGVYDAVADEDLVAGRRIAGTGEIDANGQVGRIGLLPLKVMAAHQAGASALLVPRSQADVARQAVPSGSDLQVVGVATIDDAITAVRNLPPVDGDLEPVQFRPCRQRASDPPPDAAASPRARVSRDG